MHRSQYLVLLALLAGELNALPLNINLGAYSPALVVGDGEISFGGEQDVTNLMNALEGAAVNAASGQVAQNPQQPAATQPVAVEQAAVTAPAVVEAAGVVVTPQADASRAADPELAEQIAALGGGEKKELGPRVTQAATLPEKAKRDLAGFDRALQFAEVALTKGPNIQLGTGEGGSGVGIIVNNNPAAATQQPAAGAGEARKRDVSDLDAREDGDAAEGGAEAADQAYENDKRSVQNEVMKRNPELSVAKRDINVRRKVTTVFVRSGIPGAFKAASLVARNDRDAVEAATGTISRRDVPGSAEEAAAGKRSVSDSIDEVNVNLDARDGLTMTFVETEEIE